LLDSKLWVRNCPSVQPQHPHLVARFICIWEGRCRKRQGYKKS